MNTVYVHGYTENEVVPEFRQKTINTQVMLQAKNSGNALSSSIIDEATFDKEDAFIIRSFLCHI